MELPDMALRFILASADVSTVIPGMRTGTASSSGISRSATVTRWMPSS
jgi:hypothetical protein